MYDSFMDMFRAKTDDSEQDMEVDLTPDNFSASKRQLPMNEAASVDVEKILRDAGIKISDFNASKSSIEVSILKKSDVKRASSILKKETDYKVNTDGQDIKLT